MKNFRSALLAAALSLVVAAGSATAAQATTKIRVGASPTPHAEILKVANDVLKPQGYELQIIEYSDYVQPNMALEGKELDANFFQHKPYLDDFNKEKGTKLVSIGTVHYEPFGIYAGKTASIEELADGASVAIPNDGSNETRALLLLAQEGLITLPEDASAEKGVSHLDIVDAKGYNVVPVQADMVPTQLANSDAGTLAVINGNYALAAGLKVADALAIEDASGDAAQTYANVVAVREADKDSAKTVALVKALQSETVKNFIAETYNGAVVAIF